MKIFPLLLVFFFPFLCTAQESTNVFGVSLKGKVRYIDEDFVHYDLLTKDVSRSEHRFLFDERGKPVFYGNGNIEHEWEYDSAGNLMKEFYIGHGQGGCHPPRDEGCTFYIYDSKNRKVEEWRNNTGGIRGGPMRTTYHYDSKGRLAEVNTRSFIGLFPACNGKEPVLLGGPRWRYQKCEIYSHDTAGNVIEEQHYDCYNGESYVLSLCTHYKYEEGRKVQEERSMTPFKGTSLSTWKYDLRGNKIEVCLPGNFPEKYKYNEHSDLVEVIAFKPEGGIYNKTIFFYDGHDKDGISLLKKEETTTYGPVGNIEFVSSAHYEDYDKLGNWNKKSFFYNDQLVRVEKRIIAYY